MPDNSLPTYPDNLIVCHSNLQNMTNEIVPYNEILLTEKKTLTKVL